MGVILFKIVSLSFQAPQAQGDTGQGQNFTKTFLGQVRMYVENFNKIGSGVWISISPPHTNRPLFIETLKNLSVTTWIP